MSDINWGAIWKNAAPIVAPILLFLVDKYSPVIKEKIPFWLKPLFSALLAWLVGLLSGADPGIAVGIGAGASAGYATRQLKEKVEKAESMELEPLG